MHYHTCYSFSLTFNLIIRREKPEPVSPSDAKHPWVLYQSAAVLGQHGEDCSELYRACPLSPDEVNEYLATLDLE